MKRHVYNIRGFDCANCAAKVEKHLNSKESIEQCVIDFQNERLFIIYENTPNTIEELLDVDKKEKPLIIAKKFLLQQESIKKEVGKEIAGKFDEMVRKVKEYSSVRSAEIERQSLGCVGVKRTTGQHPGGIVVIPDYMDVFDFTPFQFPADDPTSAWRTTHFDYHAIDQDVLKLDILGHSDPTQLRMIQVATGMDVTTVPLDDKETMGIFLSPEPLGVTKEQIMCETLHHL